MANGDGFTVALDGRMVKTPAKRSLIAPTEALAHAMAKEWAAQGMEIDPFSMPLTQLANSALDRTGTQRAEIVKAVSAYGGSDLICYWADAPAELIDRQRAAWRPLIDWANDRFDISLVVVQGIVHKPQEPRTLANLREEVASLDDFRLTGLADCVAAAGSLIIGLALLHGRLDSDGVFESSQVDETFQIDLWGEDWEQKQKRVGLRAGIKAAERFLGFLQNP